MDMKFVHLFGISTFCALAMHQPAASADLPVKAPTKPSPFDWTGFYFGGHVGYAAGRSNRSATQVGAPAPILTGSLDLFNSYDAFKGTGRFFNGLQAGYDHMLPSRVVLGAEVDMSLRNTIARNQTIASALIGQVNYSDTVLLPGTVRSRVGYAFNNWLAYATHE
jgi:high affinity Mn2+ porin